MPWVIYATADGRGPREIARTNDSERGELFSTIARDIAQQSGVFREVTVRWEDEPSSGAQTVFQL